MQGHGEWLPDGGPTDFRAPKAHGGGPPVVGRIRGYVGNVPRRAACSVNLLESVPGIRVPVAARSAPARSSGFPPSGPPSRRRRNPVPVALRLRGEA
ncbi:hypothetical protein DA2_1701 [Desulfovibrio sp. A2]|nr:hypothetical protein DA2_1701 [Desulfovibrio sp. A2]